MPMKRIGIAGFEVRVMANDKAMTVVTSAQNGLWRGFYGWGRSVVRKMRGADRERRVEESNSVAADASPEKRALLEKIRGIDWYHSIDLGHGVVTPGYFDHRPILEEYRLPSRLDGKRVLDVAAFDGFWAFEFEKRGAAEVVAIDVEKFGDIDLPPAVRRKFTEEKLNEIRGVGFETAKEILGSKVERKVCNIYDISPERLGMFDVVHIGDVLLHLKYPLRALENILSVTKEYALISDCYFPEFDLAGFDEMMGYMGGESDCHWWKFSYKALEHMIRSAGFSKVELLNKFSYGPRVSQYRLEHAVFRAEP